MEKETTKNIEKVSEYVEKVHKENERKKRIKIISIIISAVIALGLGIFGITKLTSIGGETHNISTTGVASYTCTNNYISKNDCGSSTNSFTLTEYKYGTHSCGTSSTYEENTGSTTFTASCSVTPKKDNSNNKVENCAPTGGSIGDGQCNWNCKKKYVVRNCTAYGKCVGNNVSKTAVSGYEAEGFKCVPNCNPGYYLNGDNCSECDLAIEGPNVAYIGSPITLASKSTHCNGMPITWSITSGTDKASITTSNSTTFNGFNGIKPGVVEVQIASGSGKKVTKSITVSCKDEKVFNTTKGVCEEITDFNLSVSPSKLYFPSGGNFNSYLARASVTDLNGKVIDDTVNFSWNPDSGVNAAIGSGVDSSGKWVNSTATISANTAGTCTGTVKNVKVTASYKGITKSETITVTIYPSAWTLIGSKTDPPSTQNRSTMRTQSGCDAYENPVVSNGKTVYDHYTRCSGCGGSSTPTTPTTPPETEACYLYSFTTKVNNVDQARTKYVWGKFSGQSGYTLQTDKKTEATCGACYTNGNNDTAKWFKVDALRIVDNYPNLVSGVTSESACKMACYYKGTDYKWEVIQPSGYTKASDITSKTDCAPPKTDTEKEACYLHNNEYVWGKFGGQSGYTKQSASTKATCGACYSNDTVAEWNTKSPGTGYKIVSEITTSDACKMACYYKDTDYKWEVIQPSGYTKASDITSKTACKEPDACYLYSYTVKVDNVDQARTKYVWGPFAGKTGYTLQTDKKTEATCGACYTNGNEDTAKWFKANDVRIVNNYPNLISGVTNSSACKMACYYKGTDYKWKVIQPSGYTKESSMTTKATCKEPEKEACYLHNGEYSWGKYAEKEGYVKQNGIDTSNDCKACYTNGVLSSWESKAPDSTYTLVPEVKSFSACHMSCYYKGNDYQWLVVQPTGYKLVSGVSSHSACKAPENDACYLHNGEYVWGKFSGQNGYVKQNITTKEACGACYSNEIDAEWNTKSPGIGYKIESGVTTSSACKKSCYYKGTDYKWEVIQPNGYTKVNDIKEKSVCKEPEKDACYIYNGEYVWGKYAENKEYKLQSSISNEDLCTNPTPEMACYSNGTEYEWTITPSKGYTKVESITTSDACEKPEKEACYIYDNQYVWGKYAKQSEYIKQENIDSKNECGACYSDGTQAEWNTESPGEKYNIIPEISSNKCEMACYSDGTDYQWVITTPKGYTKIDEVDEKDKCNKPASPACYLNEEGKRVWGEYSTNSDYKLDKNVVVEVDCKDIDVPITDQDQSLLVVICSIIFASVGAGMYIMFKKQSNINNNLIKG